jgi:hypothetical protein
MKGSGPEETLRSGSKPSGNGGLKASGNKEGTTENTTSDDGSNLETLRQGSKPKPEAVREVKENPSARKAAFNYWVRESGDDQHTQAEEGSRGGDPKQGSEGTR